MIIDKCYYVYHYKGARTAQIDALWYLFSFRRKKQINRPMTDEVEPSRAVAAMMQALEWGYEHATAAILPGLDSAVDLAESHLKSCGGNREKAIAYLRGYRLRMNR